MSGRPEPARLAGDPALAPAGRRRRDWLLFAGALAVNLLLLFWPWGVGESAVPNLDKVVHAATFASVAWTGLRVGLPRWWLVALLVVHAVSSEVVQATLLPGRDGDPADSLADVTGVLVGVLLAPIGGSWRHGRDRGGRADRAAAGGDSGTG